MSKILNIGSLNIDYVYSVPHFVTPGETMHSLGRKIFAGGKGLNQSLALAKSKAKVFHCGVCGQGSDFLVEELTKASVDVTYLKRTNEIQGHTVIQVDTTGQNCIILFAGTNAMLDETLIDKALESFDKDDILVIQNEVNMLDVIMRKAAAKGLKIYFNVSPCDASILKLPLHLCSCLVVNEIEAAFLVDSKSKDDLELVNELADKYPQSNILVTLGTAGSYYKEIGKEPIYQQSYKVKAVDTTGAGDTFFGFFTGLKAQGYDNKLALEYASKAAAISVTRQGAGSSIPTLDEVKNFSL